MTSDMLLLAQMQGAIPRCMLGMHVHRHKHAHVTHWQGNDQTSNKMCQLDVDVICIT